MKLLLPKQCSRNAEIKKNTGSTDFDASHCYQECDLCISFHSCYDKDHLCFQFVSTKHVNKYFCELPVLKKTVKPIFNDHLC